MYDYLLTSADNMVASYVFGAWNSFNAVANPWITGMMALYVIIMGYLVWLGRVNISLSDLGPRIFKLAFIYALVTNVGLLTTFLYNVFIDIPPSLINTIYASAGNNSSDIDQSMSVIFDKGLMAAGEISLDAGYNVILHIYAAWIVLLTAIVTTVAAGYIVLAKLAVAVMLALAPFFIMMYLFAGTKSLFEGWLRQILSFSLIPVLVYSLLLLIVSILGQVTDELVLSIKEKNYNLANIGTFTVVSLVSLLLLAQVKSWAAGIAGGFQLSSLGAAKGTAGAGIYASSAAGRMETRFKQWRKNRQNSGLNKPWT